MKLLITIDGEPKEVAQFLKEIGKEEKRVTNISTGTEGKHPGASTSYTYLQGAGEPRY